MHLGRLGQEFVLVHFWNNFFSKCRTSTCLYVTPSNTKKKNEKNMCKLEKVRGMKFSFTHDIYVSMLFSKELSNLKFFGLHQKVIKWFYISLTVIFQPPTSTYTHEPSTKEQKKVEKNSIILFYFINLHSMLSMFSREFSTVYCLCWLVDQLR